MPHLDISLDLSSYSEHHYIYLLDEAAECSNLSARSESSIMPGTSPVILILGAGPNIGQAVARTFALKGYKVALASRSLDEANSTDNQLSIKSDFTNSDDVVNAFKKVTEVFGIPSVVVYNGKS